MVPVGCTFSLTIYPVCIRTGCVMGRARDKYLKFESTGDRYVGRCAVSLDQLEKMICKYTPL